MLKRILMTSLCLSLTGSALASRCQLEIRNLENLVRNRDSLQLDIVKTLSKKGYALLRQANTSPALQGNRFLIKLGTDSRLNSFLEAGDLMRTEAISKTVMGYHERCYYNVFPCASKFEIGQRLSGAFIIYKSENGYTAPFDHVSFADFTWMYDDTQAPTKLIKHMVKALPSCKKLN